MTPRRDFSLLLSLAGACLLAMPASAQVCTRDDDCAEGDHCDLPPQVRSNCDGGSCGDAATIEGKCEALDPDDIECTGDDDCPNGFECLKGASAPGCDPSAGSCGDAGVRIEETGTCHAKPITCEADTDCPEGLVCGERSGSGACSISPDGGMHCQPTEPRAKECEYEPAECKQDADCEDDYACTAIGTTEECSGGGPVCVDGKDCPAPEPEQCTTRDVRICFPKRIDCADDGDCANDWRCVEIPERARGDDAPAGWEDAAAVCFPEGLALVLEGRVRGGVFSHADASGGGGEPTGADEKGASSDADCSACAVGSASRRAPPVLVLGAIGLWAAIACRRRVRRR